MSETFVEIEGRTLKLTNLGKVLFPNGFTKGQMIDYYVRIAPRMLPHLSGRNVTMVRWPDGVNGQHFFAKAVPSHAPDWIERVKLKDNTYTVCRDLPTLVFMANLAALELHVPMHRIADGNENPDDLVFDLDPGPGTDIGTCCDVALLIRDFIQPLGLETRAKTSGSKGMQIYARIPPTMGYGGTTGTTEFAKRLAEGLEAAHPNLIVSKMTKELRTGKVLIDWSQNVRAKTTVCVWSLRARGEPTVSTPVSWEEIEASVNTPNLRFTADQALERPDLWAR